MSEVKEATQGKELFLAEFERMQPAWSANGAAPLNPLRRRAIERFGKLGFPGRFEERWRHMPLAAIEATEFRSPEDRAPSELAHESAPKLAVAGLDAHLLVFVDGRFASDLSRVGDAPRGVMIGSLAEAIVRDFRAVEPYLGHLAKYDDQPYVALNTAFMSDGAFVFVPKNVKLDTPIQILCINSAEGEATHSHPRHLIVVEDAGSVRVVESYAAAGAGEYWTNAVTELFAGEGATLEDYKLQEESEAAFHVATIHGRAARASRLLTYSISVGAAHARNDIHMTLDGEGVEGVMNGLYLASGAQKVDHHTYIDHAKPRCSSHELYKGILDGHAKAVFCGRILVRENAQKTDGYQANRNLLLSPTAVVEAQPQLEIYADDVKCSHGATVGQLDEEALFYLRARGIERNDALGLLTYAFANELNDKISIEALHDYLERLVLGRFQIAV